MDGKYEYDELLYAYALGCLDMPELDKLRDYIDSGGEYSQKELGELQNLAALFPSILSMEIPGPQLKDKVARKLYRIKSERPNKKIEEKTVKDEPQQQTEQTIEEPEESVKETFGYVAQNNLNTEQEIEEELQEEEALNSEEENTHKEQEHNIQEFEIVTAKTKEEEPEPFADKEDNSPSAGYVKPNEDDFAIDKEETLSVDLTEPEAEESADEKDIIKEPSSSGVSLKERQPYSSFREREIPKKKSSKAGIIIAAILFIIVAAGLIYAYLKISSDVSVYKNSVENLNSKINSLSSEVNNNRALQNLLSTKNVKIVNLSGTKAGVPGYGKLIISFDNSKGYLQLSNVPRLTGSNSYVLWVIIHGNYTRLGAFKQAENPSDKVEYFPFQLPELSNNGGTKFLVSEEPPGTDQKPTGEILLTGTLQ